MAQVGGNEISQLDFQDYLQYTIHYYGWLHHDRSLDPCKRGAKGSLCSALSRQVFQRLVQERVVQDFARRHHITLNDVDEQQVSHQLTSLTTPGSVMQELLARHAITRDFLRSILERELLVQRVVSAVVPAATQQGLTYHVTKYVIPVDSGNPDPALFQAALTLATDGKPVPSGAIRANQWLAPFRLHGSEKTAFENAQPGDFVGPFSRRAGYVVYHLLDRAVHRYGKPARQALETTYFQHWLEKQTARMHIDCFDETGKKVACNLLSH